MLLRSGEAAGIHFEEYRVVDVIDEILKLLKDFRSWNIERKKELIM